MKFSFGKDKIYLYPKNPLTTKYEMIIFLQQTTKSSGIWTFEWGKLRNVLTNHIILLQSDYMDVFEEFGDSVNLTSKVTLFLVMRNQYQMIYEVLLKNCMYLQMI